MSNRRIKEIELSDEVFDLYDKDAHTEISNINTEITSINNDLVTMNNKIKKIKFNLSGKFLFLADSYDEYGHWISKTAAKLGLVENVDYWNLGLSGSSFQDGRWLTQVQNWYNTHQSLAIEVTHIICGGGINDSQEDVDTYLPKAMQNFSNWVKPRFVNAEIKLSFFGYCFDNTAWAAGRIAKNRAKANHYWSQAERFKMVYMPGAEMVLHNRSLVADDNLHPNNDGGTAIAECVANQIVNGSCNVTNFGVANIIQGGGTVAGNIFQIVSSNINTIVFNSLKITNDSGIPWRFENGTYINVAVCYLPYGYRLYPERRVLNFRKSDNTIVSLNALIQILDNQLQIAIQEFDGVYFKSIDCIAIEQMNFTTTIAGMID